LVEDYNQIVVQINGKVRSKISVLAGLDDDAVAAAAATEPAIADQLSGAEIRRTIVVPGRLVNFVVG
jgi:leucyl-tRNA synthetase